MTGGNVKRNNKKKKYKRRWRNCKFFFNFIFISTRAKNFTTIQSLFINVYFRVESNRWQTRLNYICRLRCLFTLFSFSRILNTENYNRFFYYSNP